jgi:hypothetical protein
LIIPKSTDAATTTTSIKQPVDDRILTSFLNFFKSDRLLAAADAFNSRIARLLEETGRSHNKQ